MVGRRRLLCAYLGLALQPLVEAALPVAGTAHEEDRRHRQVRFRVQTVMRRRVDVSKTLLLALARNHLTIRLSVHFKTVLAKATLG